MALYNRRLAGKTGAVTRKQRAFDKAQVKLDSIKKPAPASMMYISEHDDLFSNARKVPKLDGYDDIVIHGDKVGFYTYNLYGEEFSFTPSELAKMIKDSKNYHGEKVRLLSCETASEGAVAAQELADELGVEVLAPSDILWVFSDGSMTIGPDELTNSGQWVIIEPKR